MRTIKKAIKTFLFLLLGIFSLLLLYVFFNLNIFHQTKPLAASEITRYTSHIGMSNTLEYIAQKFDTHDIVFLGELHKRKQDLDFLKQLIPYLYQTKGIKIIGWEFGAAIYQKDADSIVTAPEFDRDKAIAIMRNSMYEWCYEDYLDVFQTIWQLNKSILQDSNKLRFLQLNKSYVPKRWHSKIDSIRINERATSFDNILPVLAEKEVISQNKKILIYCGLHHSLTKFKTPKFFFIKDNDGRAGQRLYEKYPGKIFQVCLLAPFPPRWLIYNNIVRGNDGEYVYPFDGLFNQLYDRLQKPFAVDANNDAFANVKDFKSFYAFDNINGIKLKDFCDGVVMLAPFDKIHPVDIIPDWITTDKQLNAVKNILPEQDTQQIKTARDLMNYIDPARNQQQIRDFHSLKKFWKE
ncbi:MAG: hypothetical protein ABUT20_04610 [Bacteroidota bacterium]